MSVSRENERLRNLLQDAGLRATRPRTALARLLFDGVDKHMTAEQVHAALSRRRARVSLATVYNALHQFTDAGLLSKVVIDPMRIYFDTNIGPHHHFFDTVTGIVADIRKEAVQIERLPKPPTGMQIETVDVVIRLRPAKNSAKTK